MDYKPTGKESSEQHIHDSIVDYRVESTLVRLEVSSPHSKAKKFNGTFGTCTSSGHQAPFTHKKGCGDEAIGGRTQSNKQNKWATIYIYSISVQVTTYTHHQSNTYMPTNN